MSNLFVCDTNRNIICLYISRKNLTAKQQNTPIVYDYDGNENTNNHKAKPRREYLLMRGTNSLKI